MIVALIVYLLAAYLNGVRSCFAFAAFGNKPRFSRMLFAAITWPFDAVFLLAASLGGFRFSPAKEAEELGWKVRGNRE